MEHITLRTQEITKKFPGVIALNRVSIDVKQGEILAIVGENGAGKSTLMKILSGAYSCDSYTGKIFIEEEEVQIRSPREAEAAGICMIYQEVSHMPALTIAENVFMGCYPKKKNGMVDWQTMFKQAKEYLEIVGLNVDAKQQLRNLSTSQQQMVSIAKALVKNPKILILDEPTSALTKSEVEKLFNIILKLKSEGISCIYISHKLDEVFRISDRVVVMRDGEVRMTAPIGELDTELLISTMVGNNVSHFNRYNKNIGEKVLEIKNFAVPHNMISGRNLLENISFELHRGEVLGLAGLVGTGRSELCECIIHYNREPSAGEVYMDGDLITIRNPNDAIRAGIALLSEDRRHNGFVGVMSIAKNTTLASMQKVLKNGLIDYKEENLAAQKYFDIMRTKAPDTDTAVQNLSGGNQQKVVLAKWMMTGPKVLILDEPTRGIDVGAKREIYSIIDELAASGVAIIIISSELPELYSLCDRFVVLHDGTMKRLVEKVDVTEDQLYSMICGLD